MTREEIKEAFCLACCESRPHRATCESFGTCAAYDRFIKALRKDMETCNPGKNLQGFDADYLQSKIDAFTEARKRDGKTADEVLEECRGGALELTWQDVDKIIVAYGYVPKLNKDGTVRPREDVFKDTLIRFKEGRK